MSGNGKPASPFHAPGTGGVPIVGQPITVSSVYVPVITAFTCNCGPAEGGQTLMVHPIAGLVQLLVAKGILTEAEVGQAFNASASCRRCRKVFNAFQPAANVQMPITVPPVDLEQVPS